MRTNVTSLICVLGLLVGQAYSQCGLTANITYQLQCGPPLEVPYADYYVSWSGGTPPYSGNYRHFDGLQINFENEYDNNLISQNHLLPSPDGVQVCGTSSLYVQDALGCVVTDQQVHCAYWVNAANQFNISSNAWNGASATATVTVVDNLNDPGDLLPQQSNEVTYSLYRSGTGVVSTGLLAAVQVASPWRLVFPGLVTGSYSLFLGPPPGFNYGPVYCEGMAVEFAVVDPNPSVVNLNARVLLGGPYGSGPLMSDQLRSLGHVPTLEPYSALGYSYVGSHGATTMGGSVLNTTGSNAIVDWVVVELRSAAQPSAVVASRSALLQRDGDVVSVDGISPVSFNMPAGNYHVSIRHRNHLAVMTATNRLLSATATLIDFTTSATATYGTNAQHNINGTMVLWPGDANSNGTVQYTGGGNDRDLILQSIGGTVPTNTVTNTYSPRDINMDGTIQYTGVGNDRDVILQTIGGVVPTATRTQQLP